MSDRPAVSIQGVSKHFKAGVDRAATESTSTSSPASSSR